ncbi:nuclear transport factor 2 family protein [Streptomyces sp. CA-251387]|uniref:nuclear transport factor 2 family protein n=1 Tax=Streptomyces sp. CA-251387 TaxID=3240064 RepID=UPI003D91C81F
MSVLQTPTTRSADALVQGLFEIIDGGRWERLSDFFADDCVYSRPGYEQLVGLERLEHFYRNERGIASGRHHIKYVVSDLEAAACWGRFIGVGKDGSRLDEEFADTYSVRDGKIVERQTFFYRPAI